MPGSPDTIAAIRSCPPQCESFDSSRADEDRQWGFAVRGGGDAGNAAEVAFIPCASPDSADGRTSRSSHGGLTLSWAPAERCDDPAEGGGHPVQGDHVQPRSRRLPRTAPDGSMSGTSPLRSGSKCRLRRCTPPRCDGAGRRASNGQNPGLASTYRALPEHEKRQAYPEAAETAQAAFADGPSRSSHCPFCTHLGWTPWMPVRVCKLRGLQLGPEGSSPRWPR